MKKYLLILLLSLSVKAATWQSMPIAVWTTNGPNALKSAVKNAEKQWSISGISFKDKALSNIVVIWERFPAVSFGNLAITLSGNNQAVIFVNGNNNTFIRWTNRKLSSVILHEFGHALGLNHNNNLSVMNPNTIYQFWPTTLYFYDKQSVAGLYP